jgi:hypothetical protein
MDFEGDSIRPEWSPPGLWWAGVVLMLLVGMALGAGTPFLPVTLLPGAAGVALLGADNEEFRPVDGRDNWAVRSRVRMKRRPDDWRRAWKRVAYVAVVAFALVGVEAVLTSAFR